VAADAERLWVNEDDQTLLPAQFFRPPDSGPYGYGPGSGPRRLMVAILVDALRSIVEPTEDPPGRRQQQRDRRWLMSDSSAALCSFRRICVTLELDPQAVRAAVMRRQVRYGQLRRIYAAHRTYGALNGYPA
jgi:hypothetical protein